MSTTTILAGFAALPLFAAGGGEGTVLRFERPTTKGLSITTAETHDLLLESLTTRFGEKDPVAQPTSMRLRTRSDVACVDEVAPESHLRRRWIAGESKLQIMDPSAVNEEEGTWQGVEIPLTTPFVDVSVAFVPAEGQPDGYGRHFDAKELREPLLPRVSAPVDWSALLPKPAADGSDVPVELGDEWELDPADLEMLIAPGGFLAWQPGPDVEADPQMLRSFKSGVGGNLYIAFDGTVTGTATARLQTVGVDPDDGSYAELAFKFDMTLRSNRDDFVDDRRLESEGELEVDVVGAVLEVALEGESSLRWSLERDQPIRGLLAARETVTMTVRVVPPGSDEVATQQMTMKGSIANNVKCREVPLSPAKRTVVER